MTTTPAALTKWFVVHFAADITFAVPLLLAPEIFLGALGWPAVDPFAARLVAAALFGIGIESLMSRNAAPGTFLTMLRLKIIWSTAAVVGMALTVVQYPSFRIPISYVLITIFVAFNVLWGYWRRRIKQELEAAGSSV